MSSITPLSFVDDGLEIEKRIRHSDSHNLRKGLRGTFHEAHQTNPSSVYTGSFIDDGADMLLPAKSTAGFGKVDDKFYEEVKAKQRKKSNKWNADMQRAISGDIQNNLARMKGIANIQVKKKPVQQTDEKACAEEKVESQKDEEKKEAVKVRVPPKWGTFVIKAGNGRIIVVDEDGEYDSGPQPTNVQRMERWVKAPSTAMGPPMQAAQSLLSVPPPPPPPKVTSFKVDSYVSKARKDVRKYSKEGSRHENAESKLPRKHEKKHSKNVEEKVTSPTNFAMAGGASGWPISLVSPTKSPPGAFPLSPVRSVTASKDSWKGNRSHGRDGAWGRLSGKESVEDVSMQSWGQGFDNKSQKATSDGSWKQDLEKASAKSASSKSWGPDLDYDYEQTPTDRSFKHSPNKASTKPLSILSWAQNVEKASMKSASWKDDFDNMSTKSFSAYRPPTVEDALETPQKEKEAWDMWATGSAPCGDDWAKQSDKGKTDWGKESREGSSSCKGRRKYKNGYDENNETYLNANWGGVPVREGPRWSSVAGWD